MATASKGPLGKSANVNKLSSDTPPSHVSGLQRCPGQALVHQPPPWRPASSAPPRAAQEPPLSPPTLGSRAWLHHQGSLESSILQRGGGGVGGRSSAHRPTCLTFPNRLEALPQQAEPALSAAPQAPKTSVATQACQGEAQEPPRGQPAQQELVSLTHHPGGGGGELQSRPSTRVPACLPAKS